MVLQQVVQVGSDDEQLLLTQGWVVAHRSFGARLEAERIDVWTLQHAIDRTQEFGTVRELASADVSAVLELDHSTLADYPGGRATTHAPLSDETAEPSPTRRAFGFIAKAGVLVAMTFVDIDGFRAETDFTVVHQKWRGRGIGRAVKAASVRAVTEDGVRLLRTGGSAENAAIIKANSALGYRIDEEWVTLQSP